MFPLFLMICFYTIYNLYIFFLLFDADSKLKKNTSIINILPLPYMQNATFFADRMKLYIF